jgi:hypothetical protein
MWPGRRRIRALPARVILSVAAVEGNDAASPQHLAGHSLLQERGASLAYAARVTSHEESFRIPMRKLKPPAVPDQAEAHRRSVTTQSHLAVRVRSVWTKGV